ncbi:MAG: PAS domain-containing protein, partial [Pseudonocardia sp.]|nr:PAS domain-containing protein [Pseudonocardia sp.]
MTGQPGRTIQDVLADGGGLLEVLFHRTPMAVAVLDRELVLHRFNKTFASAVAHNGVAGAARVGDRLLDLFPGNEEQTWAMFEPVFAGGTRWYHGVPHRTGDSVSYWDLVLVPLRDGGGEGPVVGAVEIFTEATERVTAVEDLQRSERRFRSILLNSSDVTIVIDTDGVLRYVAPSVRRLLDIPDDQPLAKGKTMPVHPDDRAMIRDSLRRAGTVAGESPPFRVRLRHADRSWHTFEVVPVNLLDDPDV